MQKHRFSSLPSFPFFCDRWFLSLPTLSTTTYLLSSRYVDEHHLLKRMNTIYHESQEGRPKIFIELLSSHLCHWFSKSVRCRDGTKDGGSKCTVKEKRVEILRREEKEWVHGVMAFLLFIAVTHVTRLSRLKARFTKKTDSFATTTDDYDYPRTQKDQNFEFGFSFRSLVYGKLLTHAMERAELGLSVGEGSSEEKWMKYYSFHHQIFLVGEGDFSFSLCLAQSFGSAFNIVASSLDTYDQVVRKYKKAMSNLLSLTKLGAMVLHGVDATQMKFHPYLKMRRFDRIIFNFPHAGFHGKEDSISLIQEHKNLVLGFFMNARSMLRFNGEVHVNHKTTPPFNYWCINELGIQSFLWPIECVDFKKEDYPGYNNKRGDGSRADEPFPLGKCSTFKFVAIMKKESNPRNQRILSNHHYPRSFSQHSSPSVVGCRKGQLPMFGGGNSCDLQRSLWCESNMFMYPETEYVRNMDMILGRQVSGYVHGISSDLQRSSRPASAEFRFPQTKHVRNMDMILGRQVSGYVHGISSNLQRSFTWPKSTEFRYPQTEHVRDMGMILGRSVSEYVHGISSDLQRRPWPKSESGNVRYLPSDNFRDGYDSLRSYHVSWF
ncbi:uncharacterized protein LOC129302597 [Prosopis cineraria]|uniref:uncharacterized protein LOC129302597 n=1 Tax=Prosopis cineraria TaxID=364024 RepID=UPI00240F0696|nr:uncharacterized protein LOC129302597 [Prosopis cineraria]